MSAASAEYGMALMWSLLATPLAFKDALAMKFGPDWHVWRFDEVYDEYYADLARVWLDVNSASRPRNLSIMR
ncbi:hypothetical protein [Candidatus Poriferisodalis sp.]|uniref:hypothetical protein n=1 Tax=Candidatus Poriferisodalis sp. TaxID=3101277 RepID=UPI003B02E7D6